MRVGVLDIGSNTGHLLVVDAHGGAAPLPAYSFKQPLRLAEHLDEAGDVSQTGVAALTEFTARGAAGGRGQGLRGHPRLRDVRGPRRGQQRRRPRARARAHRRGDRRALGRGRGPADLPRRTPLVRLVGRPARRLRHRRRLAGDRRRRGRGTRRGLDAAARRRAAGPHALRLGRPPTRRPCTTLRREIRAEIARDAGHLLRCGAAGPRGGDLQDVPVAGPHLRRAAVGGRPAGAAHACRSTTLREWIPKLVAMDPDELADLPGRLAEPHPPDRARAPWSRRPAWTSSTSPSSRSARGRCARA